MKIMFWNYYGDVSSPPQSAMDMNLKVYPKAPRITKDNRITTVDLYIIDLILKYINLLYL